VVRNFPAEKKPPQCVVTVGAMFIPVTIYQFLTKAREILNSVWILTTDSDVHQYIKNATPSQVRIPLAS
jgi:hypothetical protein